MIMLLCAALLYLSFFSIALADTLTTPFRVPVDQTKLIRLKAPVTDVILGDPSTADVAVISGNMLAITGKSAGATNLIVTDENGAIAVDTKIYVESMDGQKVTLMKGVNRETYSCAGQCNPVMNASDGSAHFSAISKQTIEKWKSSSSGGSAPGDFPCDSPNQIAADGSRCGGRSAFDKAGGRKGYE